MSTLTAVIVDDEQHCRDALSGLLQRKHPEIDLLGMATNVPEGIELLSKVKPKVLFLDIEMGKQTGFDLLQAIGPDRPHVIFTTAHEGYAVKAIRFSALDYLLKPVQPDELAEALARFEQRRAIEHRSAVQRQFLSNLGAPDEQAMKLTLTTGDRTWFVSPAELTHCTADDNYTELHTLDGRRFVSARTLKDYEDMLAPLGFLRVHRSSLVNRSAITHLDDGHVVLKNSARVEISRRKKEEVLKALAG